MKRARYDPYDPSQTSTISTRSRGARSRARGKFKIYKSLRGPTPSRAVYTFERNVDHDVYINLNSGINGIGNGIGFSWSLDNLLVEYGNTSQTNVAIPGSAEFQALFDQWRIDRVDMKMYFSATNLGLSASTTHTFTCPVYRCVTDYDNQAVDSTEVLEEYPQCRTFQIADGRVFKHTVYKPGANQSTQVDTGADVPSTNKRSPWCETSVPGVSHYGIKVKYDPFNVTIPDYTPDYIVGCVKFNFKIYYSMKLAK